MARQHQPGLLVVDRSVHGRYENYTTPEQRVPEKALDYPWETCMTMGNSWSYVPNDHYKPARQLIHLLVDIVAKGSNFLLNVGPDPNGELAPDAYARMAEIGAWMEVNGEAIYGTRPIEPFKEAKTCFTQKNDGTVYAIYLADEDETAPPAKLLLYGMQPKVGAKITLLGYDKPLKWEKVGTGALIELPAAVQKNPPCQYAWAFKVY